MNINMIHWATQFSPSQSCTETLGILARNLSTFFRSVFLKVDVGNGRAGVWWEDSACVEIPKAVKDASDTIEFIGLYVHCSDSYEAKDVKAVEQVGFMLLHSLLFGKILRYNHESKNG